LFCFDLMLGRSFQFCIIEEPIRDKNDWHISECEQAQWTHHVTLGVGNASQVIDKVAFCPSSTFVSDRD
jgi:hypothetical protein